MKEEEEEGTEKKKEKKLPAPSNLPVSFGVVCHHPTTLVLCDIDYSTSDRWNLGWWVVSPSHSLLFSFFFFVPAPTCVFLPSIFLVVSRRHKKNYWLLRRGNK